jgi:hypothetical protein
MLRLLRCTTVGLFFSYCGSVAAPRAKKKEALAPTQSTCEAPRAAPRAAAWAPWSSTCDAQRGNGLGTAAKHLQRTKSGAAGNGLSRYRGLLICPFTTSAPHPPWFMRPSFANKRNSTTEVRGLGVRCGCGPRGILPNSRAKRQIFNIFQRH